MPLSPGELAHRSILQCAGEGVRTPFTGTLSHARQEACCCQVLKGASSCRKASDEQLCLRAWMHVAQPIDENRLTDA